MMRRGLWVGIVVALFAGMGEASAQELSFAVSFDGTTHLGDAYGPSARAGSRKRGVKISALATRALASQVVC